MITHKVTWTVTEEEAVPHSPFPQATTKERAAFFGSLEEAQAFNRYLQGLLLSSVPQTSPSSEAEQREHYERVVVNLFTPKQKTWHYEEELRK